jgi:hypothetical protein
VKSKSQALIRKALIINEVLIKIVVLVTVLSVLALLEGCGSSASSFTPTLGNPNQGVTLQSIKITPTTPLLQLASSRQLYATGVYSDGSMQDLTAHVTWSITTAQGTSATALSVNSAGIVTGSALGVGVVSATLQSVIGLIQVTVNTDGYASNTLALLTVPYKNSVIDVAYQPHSLTQTQGVYTVEEINLDANLFTSQLPVAAAVLASIPMPQGFVPNAAIASPASSLVAVISYSSPNVQVIDASNQPDDTLSNTLIGTFKSPITQSVTFNGTSCMICAGVVNPIDNLLILSTAQGYYTMNLTTGTFTALAFASPVFPAPGFTLDPIASTPFIVSPTFGQDPQNPSEVQILTLPTGSGQGTVTTYTNFGLTQPNAAALNLSTQTGAVSQNDLGLVDEGANYEALVTLGSGPSTTSNSPVSDLNLCSGTIPLSMATLATPPSVVGTPPSEISPDLFLAQPGGNCIAFETWPSAISTSTFGPTFGVVGYAYGSMPNTPDGNGFTSAADPNTIASFTSVVDSNNYAVLVDTNQNWVAKINLSGGIGVVTQTTSGGASTLNPPPSGNAISAEVLASGLATDPVVYLPAPDSVAILSLNEIDFGTVAVGTPSLAVTTNLTNVGTGILDVSGISVTGPNAADFSFTTSCSTALASETNCSISIIFTPSAAVSCPSTATPAIPCASLNIADNGGESPQIVQLYGIGQ